jgi:hypothetical protein
LAECGLSDDGRREEVISRLTDLPPSLRGSIEQRCGLSPTTMPRAVRKYLRPDGDTLAQMLRLNSGAIDPKAKWSDLSRAEKAAANRMWDWFANLPDLSPLPQGKSANIDPAIVLYTAFTLREALGRERFGYSTSPLDNRRSGPFLRAVAAALKAQLADERRQRQALGPIGVQETLGAPAQETLRGILRAANSEAFQIAALRFGLEPRPGAVADYPAQFRLLLAEVERQRKRRSVKRQ